MPIRPDTAFPTIPRAKPRMPLHSLPTGLRPPAMWFKASRIIKTSPSEEMISMNSILSSTGGYLLACLMAELIRLLTISIKIGKMYIVIKSITLTNN